MAAGNINSKLNTFIQEKYIPLELKIKIAVGALCFLIPIALCYFFLFKPNFEEIDKLDKQIVTAELELEKARKAASNLPKYEKELAELQKEFDEKSVILPTTKEIPNLLRSISDHGKSAGLDFLSFQPGGETQKDFYAEIPINIATKGPYHNMGFFLDQISKLERLVTVNNIQMSSPRLEGGEMLLNATCRLITYRFTNKKLPSKKKK
jgi:type IV pilus assembly protein PilO